MINSAFDDGVVNIWKLNPCHVTGFNLQTIGEYEN
jgi:hypothetical protein